MKRKEFMRWLESLGATKKEGGDHTRVYLNGRQSVVPRHTVIKKGTLNAIKRQLNIR
jgi:mRNA interferase HicA